MVYTSFDLKQMRKAWVAGRLALERRPGAGPLSNRPRSHTQCRDDQPCRDQFISFEHRVFRQTVSTTTLSY